MKCKISDVCQILDKSKFSATSVFNGVTFTNNGDGSYTINGTSTATTTTYFHFYNIEKDLRGSVVRGNISNGYYAVDVTYDHNNGYLFYTIFIGQTFDNLKIYPQIFDLTATYGVGNEPTTVAQFTKDFPNKIYPYSPKCWVDIKRLHYIRGAKNLFNKDDKSQIINGYISATNMFSSSSLDKTLIIPCVPNTTYTFSKSALNPSAQDRLRIGDYPKIPVIGNTINNVVNIGEPPSQNYITITTSDTAKYLIVTIGLFNSGVTTTLDDILNTCQLEIGNEATTYEPYKSVCAYKGKYVNAANAAISFS